MDQVFFVGGGAVVAVIYVLSRVKLAEKAMFLVEKLTGRKAPAKEKAARRGYYVRGVR